MMKQGIKKFNRLVVDESISTAQLSSCQKWLEKHQLRYQQPYQIADHHPGMPDNHILKTVLTKQDAMLTADRSFHNRLLKEGYSSLYIDDGLRINPIIA